MDIKIGNVSKQVTPDSLAAVFSTYGNVTATTIFDLTHDAKTAFITMPNDNEAKAAIDQLNGCFVDGQALLVEPARAAKCSAIRSSYRRVRSILSSRGK